MATERWDIPPPIGPGWWFGEDRDWHPPVPKQVIQRMSVAVSEGTTQPAGKTATLGITSQPAASPRPAKWRQSDDGRWQRRGPDGYWYPADGPPQANQSGAGSSASIPTAPPLRRSHRRIVSSGW